MASQDLYSLIDDVVRRVNALDPGPGPDSKAFAVQLLEARPDLFAQLGADAPAEEVQRVAEQLAACQIRLIKEIPVIVEAMLSGIDRRSTEPAVRCALIGSLAYLVRLRDLLPDDLPGGYGFVDDCIVLRATISELITFLPQGFTTAEREHRLLELLATSVPVDRLPEFQVAVEEIWLTFHALLWEAEEDVTSLGTLMIEDPLGTPLPQPERESIPLPPGPRLSMAPGEETLKTEGSMLIIRFAKSGTVLIGDEGKIVEWE